MGWGECMAPLWQPLWDKVFASILFPTGLFTKFDLGKVLLPKSDHCPFTVRSITGRSITQLTEYLFNLHSPSSHFGGWVLKYFGLLHLRLIAHGQT